MKNNSLDYISDIKSSTDSSNFLDHHDQVVAVTSEFNNNRQTYFDYVKGQQYTPIQLLQFRIKNKVPVIFNKLKGSERAMLGTFLSNGFDVEFQAVEPDDSGLAEVLQKLAIWQENENQVSRKDIDIIRQAWASGNAFQESYVDVGPGKKPTIITQNLNPFSVYWDPNSKDLVTRDDALFVDRDVWLYRQQIIDLFPEMENKINESLKDYETQGYSDASIAYKDRDHESMDTRNGRYRVTERFTRVNEKYYFIIDDNYNRIEVEKDRLPLLKAAGIEYYHDTKEIIWHSVACRAMEGNEYLFNDKYFAQPRSRKTNKIIWPIVELVAEELNGTPVGFVENLIGQQDVLNAMMTATLDSAKNSAGSGYFFDKGAFDSQRDWENFVKFKADSNQNFAVKEGRVSNAAAPIPKSQLSSDNNNMIAYADNSFEENSSTPKAMQGLSTGGNTSGILNQQRIEQANSQMLVFTENYRKFEQRRLELWYSYWREFYKEEMVFSITGPEGKKENVAINQLGVDPTGNIKKMYNVSESNFDISVVNSKRSATFRNKITAMLTEVFQSGAAQQDPVLSSYILSEIFSNSDAPERIKNGLVQYNTVLQQFKNQEQQQNSQQAQQAQMVEQQRLQMEAQGKQAEIQKTQTEAEKNAATSEKIKAEVQQIMMELRNTAQAQMIQQQLDQIESEELNTYPQRM